MRVAVRPLDTNVKKEKKKEKPTPFSTHSNHKPRTWRSEVNQLEYMPANFYRCKEEESFPQWMDHRIKISGKKKKYLYLHVSHCREVELLGVCWVIISRVF